MSESDLLNGLRMEGLVSFSSPPGLEGDNDLCLPKIQRCFRWASSEMFKSDAHSSSFYILTPPAFSQAVTSWHLSSQWFFLSPPPPESLRELFALGITG